MSSASNGSTNLITQTNASGQPTQIATAYQPSSDNDGVNENSSFASKVLNNIYRLCCCFIYPSTPSRTGPALPPQSANAKGKKCLVLDLDETLVHSSFKPVPNPDYVIPVEIEGTTHHVYVIKRPGVDPFLEQLGKIYEIVIYTASLAKYADPLLDLLDTAKVVEARLFRESCTCHEGNYVKDLSLLGRDITQTIIVDNSPISYLFQPENAIGVSSFIDDMADRELFYCLPFLESIADAENVIDWLGTYPSFIAKQQLLAQTGAN